MLYLKQQQQQQNEKPKDNCISPRILVHIPTAGKQSNTRALQRDYGSQCVFVQVVAAFTMKVNLTFAEVPLKLSVVEQKSQPLSLCQWASW